MTRSGVIDPGVAEHRRQTTMALLRRAGLDPADYGYGAATPIPS